MHALRKEFYIGNRHFDDKARGGQCQGPRAKKRGIFAQSLMKGNPNSHSPSSALFSALFSGICTTLWRVEVQSALWRVILG